MAKANLPKAEDFESNSIISRIEDPTPSKRIVHGKILRKKKAGTLGGDVGVILGSIFEEIILPALKTLISDAITSGIDMALFGESRSRKRTSNPTGSRVSYQNFYQNIASGTNKRRPARSSAKFEPIIFENGGEAKDVLSAMIDILSEYPHVTVADLNELAGLDGAHTDNKYGWDNLSEGRVRRTTAGYLLELPEPEELTN